MERDNDQQRPTPDWVRQVRTQFRLPRSCHREELDGVMDDVSGLEKRIECLEHMIATANKSEEQLDAKEDHPSVVNRQCSSCSDHPASSHSAGSSSSATQLPCSEADAAPSPNVESEEGKSHDADTNSSVDILSRTLEAIGQLRADMDALRVDVGRSAELASTVSELKANSTQMRGALVVLSDEIVNIRTDIKAIVSRQLRQEQTQAVLLAELSEQDPLSSVLRGSSNLSQAEIRNVMLAALPTHSPLLQAGVPGVAPPPPRCQQPQGAAQFASPPPQSSPQPSVPSFCRGRNAPNLPWERLDHPAAHKGNVNTEAVPEAMYQDSPRQNLATVQCPGRELRSNRVAAERASGEQCGPETVNMQNYYFGMSGRQVDEG